MRRTTLVLVILTALLLPALSIIGSDGSDGSEEVAPHSPMTNFIIGHEYGDTIIAFGIEPQGSIPGMTLTSKIIDGLDCIVVSGTPTSWGTVRIAYTAAQDAVAGVYVTTYPEDNPEYGDMGVGTGGSTSATLTVGVDYSKSIYYGNFGFHISYGDGKTPTGSIPGMEVYSSTTIEDGKGVHYVSLRGTPTTAGDYTIGYTDENSVSRSFIIHVVEVGISAGSITLTGDDSITTGETTEYTATVEPADAANKSVIWKISSGNTYGKLDGSIGDRARVTGLSGGYVTIMARSLDDSNITQYDRIKVSQLYNYQLSFSANGGTDAPASIIAEPTTDTTYRFTIPEDIPEREGYLFLGWGTYASSTSIAVTPGKTYTVESTGIDTVKMLYAIWELIIPAENVSIQGYENSTLVRGTESGMTDIVVWAWTGKDTYVYDTNTATFKTCTAQVISGSCVTVTVTDAASKSCSHLKITPTGTVGTAIIRVTTYDGNAHMDLNVQINRTYYATLTYDANGGTGAPPAEVDDTYYDYQFWWCSEVEPVREGYTFLGWAESRDATQPVYSYSDTSLTDRIESPLGVDKTLYAVWKESVRYTLILHSSGGSGIPTVEPVYSITGSVTFTLPTDVPVWTDHTFLGWSENSGATEPTYSAGGTYTTSSTTSVLYAVWKDDSITYVLTFDSNGGTGGPGTMEYRTTDPQHTFDDIAEPTRDGWLFIGWSWNRGSATVDFQPWESITLQSSQSERTIYAIWKEDIVTVRFWNGSEIHDTVSVTRGTVPILPSDPSKEGWVFKGWFHNTDATIRFDPSSQVISDMDLYAGWTEKLDFTTVPKADFDVRKLDDRTYRFDATISEDYYQSAETTTWTVQKDGAIVYSSEGPYLTYHFVDDGEYRISVKLVNSEGVESTHHEDLSIGDTSIEDGGSIVVPLVIASVVSVFAILIVARFVF